MKDWQENYFENAVVPIDRTDLKLLSLMDLNCREPRANLARKLGVSRQVLDYRFDRLCENGIITAVFSTFSPSALGLKIYKVYLRLNPLPDQRAALISYLEETGRLHWISEGIGKWDLLLGLFYRDEVEILEIANDMLGRFSTLISQEVTHPMIYVLEYPKMYFTRELSRPQLYIGPKKVFDLHPIDLPLLAELVDDAQTSVSALAETLDTTRYLVSKRIEVLKQEGVLLKHRVAVDLHKLGLKLFKIVLHIGSWSKREQDRFEQFVGKLPSIQYILWNVRWLEIELIVKDHRECDQIVTTCMAQFPKMLRGADYIELLSDNWDQNFLRTLIKLQKNEGVAA